MAGEMYSTGRGGDGGHVRQSARWLERQLSAHVWFKDSRGN